jgi:hypothetical protein
VVPQFCGPRRPHPAPLGPAHLYLRRLGGALGVGQLAAADAAADLGDGKSAVCRGCGVGRFGPAARGGAGRRGAGHRVPARAPGPSRAAPPGAPHNTPCRRPARAGGRPGQRTAFRTSPAPPPPACGPCPGGPGATGVGGGRVLKQGCAGARPASPMRGRRRRQAPPFAAAAEGHGRFLPVGAPRPSARRLPCPPPPPPPPPPTPGGPLSWCAGAGGLGWGRPPGWVMAGARGGRPGSTRRARGAWVIIAAAAASEVRGGRAASAAPGPVARCAGRVARRRRDRAPPAIARAPQTLTAGQSGRRARRAPAAAARPAKGNG